MGTAAFGRALAKRVLSAFGVQNTAYTNPIDIGGTSSPTDNKATWSYGFPSKTMMPVDTTNPSQGGIPPNGKDMNGVLNSISAECENSMNGILPNEWIAPNVWTSVDSSWKGYPQGAVVLYPTGATASRKKLYQSTANNNLDTPSSSSKWIALEPSSRFPNYSRAAKYSISRYDKDKGFFIDSDYLWISWYAMAQAGGVDFSVNGVGVGAVSDEGGELAPLGGGIFPVTRGDYVYIRSHTNGFPSNFLYYWTIPCY